jgi:protein-S-isoprenylcysteine O-methyltransferase Ste14
MPEIAGRFVLFALIHSLLATNAVKDRVCRHRSITRIYRLTYNLLALGSFAWVLAAMPNSPVLYAISGIPAVILRCIQACALLLLCRCAAQTGLGDFIGISQLMTGQENAPQFTRSGCYRVVRHPQYTLALLFLLATPGMSANFALFTLLSFLYFAIGGNVEEARLRNTFGMEYRRYQTEVPMFIPRWTDLRPHSHTTGQSSQRSADKSDII